MRVLITGANGYVGKSLHNALKNTYDVTAISRNDFDLCDYKSMNNFFTKKSFDVVLHCAVKGGSRLKEDTFHDMDTNLMSYYNLLQHKEHYNKFIYFGSGAEIFISEKPYGLGKKVISKSVSEIENFYNIRIFNVFDENELSTRFMKSNINRYINSQPMIIIENKNIDFFYMKDFVSVVQYYIENNNPPKEFDCSYSKQHTLLEILNYINDLSDKKSQIIFESNNFGVEYCGKYTNLNLNYIGLESGIRETYSKLIVV